MKKPEGGAGTRQTSEPVIPLCAGGAIDRRSSGPFKESLAPFRPTPNANAPPSSTRIIAAPTSPSPAKVRTVDDLVLNRLAQTLQVPDYSARPRKRPYAANAQDDDWVRNRNPNGLGNVSGPKSERR